MNLYHATNSSARSQELSPTLPLPMRILAAVLALMLAAGCCVYPVGASAAATDGNPEAVTADTNATVATESVARTTTGLALQDLGEGVPVITSISKEGPAFYSDPYTYKNKAKHIDYVWTSYNKVSITYSTGNGSALDTRLERSTSPTSSFTKIDADCYDGTCSDEKAPRGTTLYYRVVTTYDCMNAAGMYYRKDVASQPVAITTTPKPLATTGKVKVKGSWKTNAPYSKKTKRYTFKISWKKLPGVSGYYVFRGKERTKQLKDIKGNEFLTDSTGWAAGNGPFYYPVVARKDLKKIKTLKASATSYTFTKKNSALKYVLTNFYVVVPYVKQNGKIITLDANKAYYPYKWGKNTGSFPHQIFHEYVKMGSSEFKNYVHFPL